MSFGKGEVTRGLPMQESQLNDEGSMTKAIVKIVMGRYFGYHANK